MLYYSDDFHRSLDEKLELLQQLSDETARWLEEERYSAAESNATASSFTFPFEDGAYLADQYLSSLPFRSPPLMYRGRERRCLPGLCVRPDPFPPLQPFTRYRRRRYPPHHQRPREGEPRMAVLFLRHSSTAAPVLSPGRFSSTWPIPTKLILIELGY